METLQFIYTDKEILDEVTKRTSYLGKSRGTEQQMHLLDRLSLTEGESFMFDSLLEDAINETYDWIKAFGRGIEDACVHEENEITEEKEVTLTVYKTEHFDENMEHRVRRYLFSALVDYIIGKWFEYVFPDESVRFLASFEDNAQKAKNALDCEVEVMQRSYNLF